MSRTPVTLRDATTVDVPFLLELWGESVRRADPSEQAADLELVVKEAAKSAEQRLVVAERDGEPVGAVFMQVTTLTPLNLEPVVRAIAPVVVPGQRRQGVGRVLVDAMVTWAEELGVGTVTTAVPTGSRAGNRFMARLSMGPRTTVRVAPTPLVRSKLTALMPTSQRVSERANGRRQRGQLLAVRRRQRRAATQSPEAG